MDRLLIRQRLQEAVQHHLAGRTREAEEILEQMVAICPSDADALYLLGGIALRKGEYEKAIKLIQRAIDVKPSNADYHYNLAGGYYSLTKWEDAACAYRRATELGPDFFEAFKGLGAALGRLARYDQAMVAFHSSLKLNPKQFNVYLDLAGVFEAQNKLETAAQTIQQALQLEPFSAEAHARLASIFLKKNDRQNAATAFFNAGVSLQREQKKEQSIEAYEEALRLNPNHPKAAHALCSLTGKTPKTAPKEYVIDLFNEYADHFDEHLDQLEYQAPEWLRKAVGRFCAAGQLVERILDLGCGTGKCGVLFRDLAAHLSGIDLAPKMIETCKQKDVYDTLHLGDLTEILRKASDKYDIIIAADVFIYVGELNELFSEVSRVCSKGSLFAFSIEAAEGEDFVLRDSGRFAHAPEYIQELAETTGFSIEYQERASIRLHEKKSLPGVIFVLKRH